MNDIINISNRLKCVASLVNKGARVADIGTDHAYLPIYLVQNGISNKVYACDVRKEPLRRAQLHIDEYGLSDKITTQLCDGLKGINKGDVDTVTICGMGGKLMKSILQAGIDKLGYNTQLVLSAQSELRDFRAYLLEAGIDIKSEHILLEDGKYYFIFDCVYNTPYEQHFNKNVVDADDIYKNDNQNNNEKKITAYTEEELRYGKYLLDNKSEVLYESVTDLAGTIDTVNSDLVSMLDKVNDNIAEYQKILDSFNSSVGGTQTLIDNAKSATSDFR
mgnify:CR=1 FL=1